MSKKRVPFIVARDSSNIAKWRYILEDKTIEIIFKGNQQIVYSYEGVGPAIAKSFSMAESKGNYFHIHIKNQYKMSKNPL
jgi:hypothetical protein